MARDNEHEHEENETEEESEQEETGLSEEEVNKRVEAARKQEKDKLYGEITDLKSMLKEQRDTAKAEREAKAKVEREAEERAEQERLAQLSNDDRMAEQLKRFEEQLAREAEARLVAEKRQTALEERLEEEHEQREVDEYRRQILEAAREEGIIEELVTGTTRDDIDRNAALAKARFKEYFDATVQKAEGNHPTMPGPTDPDPSALEEQELQKHVANFEIDADRYYRDRDYATEVDKKRKEIQERLGSTYRNFASGGSR